VGETSVFTAVGTVFRDSTSTVLEAGILLSEKARGSMTDCHVIGHVTNGHSNGIILQGGSMSILRTTFRDNRATQYGGCFAVYQLGTLHIEDSDIFDCWADDHSGMLYMQEGFVTITRSRMVGNGATGSGGLARLASANSNLRITTSTITHTNSGEFAIIVDDITAPDFLLQLDTIVVDGSVDILSHSAVLVQNCKGFNSTAIRNASVGTCQSTSDFCLAESCADADDHVGIDCICFIDGAPNPFPSDCMQSAVIEARPLPFAFPPFPGDTTSDFCSPPTQVPVPSTHTLTYLVSKPLNKTTEFVLSNVR
jgi:hypothetical protein